MREAMERYLASRTYAPTSLKQRRSILSRFVEQFDPATGDAEAFLDWWATTEGLRPASRRATLQAVSGFLDWLVLAGVRTDNPARLVRMPTVPRSVPKTLTDAEVDRLRDQVAGTHLELPVALMLELGLRRTEVVTLPADALVDGQWLRVEGKGGKQAMIPATDHVVALWPVDGGEVWPWSTTKLHDDVKAAMADAGISAEHGCHSLRRTCATRLQRRGVPLAVISSLLRHESPSTTVGHYTAVSAEDMRRAVA